MLEKFSVMLYANGRRAPPKRMPASNKILMVSHIEISLKSKSRGKVEFHNQFTKITKMTSKIIKPDINKYRLGIIGDCCRPNVPN